MPDREPPAQSRRDPAEEAAFRALGGKALDCGARTHAAWIPAGDVEASAQRSGKGLVEYSGQELRARASRSAGLPEKRPQSAGGIARSMPDHRELDLGAPRMPIVKRDPRGRALKAPVRRIVTPMPGQSRYRPRGPGGGSARGASGGHCGECQRDGEKDEHTPPVGPQDGFRLLRSAVDQHPASFPARPILYASAAGSEDLPIAQLEIGGLPKSRGIGRADPGVRGRRSWRSRRAAASTVATDEKR